MALPTVSKTWSFHLARKFTAPNPLPEGADATVEQCRALMLGIKNAFMADGGCGWTVERCSTSQSTVVSNTDLWLTPANLGWSDTQAHSWIVMSNETLGGELCIDLCSPYVTSASVVWAPAGFPAESGTTSSRPSAPDEIVLLNGGFTTTNSATATYVLHAWKSTDGCCTRILVYESGSPILFWMFEKVANPTTGFSPAVVVSAGGASYGQLSFDHLIYYPFFAALANGPIAVRTTTEAVAGPNGFRALSEVMAARNDFDHTYPLTPIGLASIAPNNVGRLGELSDIWFGSSGRHDGDTYPGNGERRFAQFGCLVFPWDGTDIEQGSDPITR